jgi:DNA-binding XRE family transcriptional regulator
VNTTRNSAEHVQGGYEPTRRLIRDELRRMRQAAGLSQSELGDAIGTSRFTVNRLEAGKMALSVDLATRIEEALTGEGLVSLVTKLDQLEETAELRSGRDILVRRLLRTPRVHSVRIVLADDLDVHEIIAGIAGLKDARIELIVPSPERERELFHGQPIYGHIESQIKRVNDLNDSDHGVTVEVRESGAVHSPVLVVRSPAGIECAYWPVLPVGGRVRGRDIEAHSSVDPATTSRIDAYVDAVHAESSRLQRNDALAVVDPKERPEGENRPFIFTRFAPSSDPTELDEGEALAVALVVIHAMCPRRAYGIGRRILVFKRSDVGGRWSLPGHSVEEVDVRRARRRAEHQEFEDLPRSTSEPLTATLDHAPWFGESGGEIPLAVFQEAASRWLFAAYGIEVDVNRLMNVVLPPPLQQIAKPGDPKRPGRIIPRLFALEIDAAELTIIKDRADVEEWGRADFAEHELNDFLKDAEDEGFLAGLCQELGAAER